MYSSVFARCLCAHNLAHTQDLPGLTDTTRPRRLGPKRASRIRKLFNLGKEDDVRKYVIRRVIEKVRPRLRPVPVRVLPSTQYLFFFNSLPVLYYLVMRGVDGEFFALLFG